MASTQRQSILCPNCRKLISRNESRCPYCGIASPGSWWKSILGSWGFFRGNQLISNILYANVIVYVLSLLLDPVSIGLSANPFTMLSPSNPSLLLLGATGTIPIDHLHRWWSFVSANYLHGGILHILFNMIALRQIGPLIVQEYGAYRTFIIYTLGGVFGFWVSYMAGVRFTIGASAAVTSLIGAALYFGKSRGGSYGQAVYKQIGSWALAIFIFGFLIPEINNWGHGGGMLAGAALGFVLKYGERKRENLSHRAIALFCLVITIIVLAWALATSVLYRLQL